MGEYKGSGLALMLGLLGGVLNGAAFGRDVVDFNADDSSETNTGHFIIAADITRFIPLETFNAEVDRHVREFKQSKRLPGVDEIRLPGDRRARVPRRAPARWRADRAGADGAARQARGGIESDAAAGTMRSRRIARRKGFVMPGHSRSKNGVASLAYVPGIQSYAWLAMAQRRGLLASLGNDGC